MRSKQSKDKLVRDMMLGVSAKILGRDMGATVAENGAEKIFCAMFNKHRNAHRTENQDEI